MAKMAVIKTGGKQYLVKKGDKLKVEKLKGEPGKETVFKDVLLVFDGNKSLEIGKPKCKTSVKGKIIKTDRVKKVSVIKYKPKVRYRRNVGHRQPYTEVEISSIGS